MSIAQELYEGIELGEYGLTGLITYMRTDSLPSGRRGHRCRCGASFAAATARNTIRQACARYKTKGGAQDAHEAIRPSNVQLTAGSKSAK